MGGIERRKMFDLDVLKRVLCKKFMVFSPSVLPSPKLSVLNSYYAMVNESQLDSKCKIIRLMALDWAVLTRRVSMGGI